MIFSYVFPTFAINRVKTVLTPLHSLRRPHREMANLVPAPRTAWVGDDSAPLGTPLRIDEDGCALTAVSPRPHLQVPVDADVGETLSSDGCGATSSGGLLFSLADELQSLLLAKLQAKELLSLAKTCKRAREVIMEGLISDSIWEQVLSPHRRLPQILTMPSPPHIGGKSWLFAASHNVPVLLFAPLD